MAIYSVSLGLCYASLNLGIDADFTEFYRPLGTVASYHSRMYVVTQKTAFSQAAAAPVSAQPAAAAAVAARVGSGGGGTNGRLYAVDATHNSAHRAVVQWSYDIAVPATPAAGAGGDSGSSVLVLPPTAGAGAATPTVLFFAGEAGARRLTAVSDNFPFPPSDDGAGAGAANVAAPLSPSAAGGNFSVLWSQPLEQSSLGPMWWGGSGSSPADTTANVSDTGGGLWLYDAGAHSLSRKDASTGASLQPPIALGALSLGAPQSRAVLAAGAAGSSSPILLCCFSNGAGGAGGVGDDASGPAVVALDLSPSAPAGGRVLWRFPVSTHGQIVLASAKGGVPLAIFSDDSGSVLALAATSR